jgi:hypothetical protein
MLYNEPENNIWPHHLKITKDPVHYVYIHNTDAMEQFVGCFLNATKLSLQNF